MEVKDVLKALGLPEDAASVEAIVSAADKRFVVRENAHSDEGVRGSIYTSFSGEHTKAFAKEFELDKSEIDGKSLKEVMKLGASKLREKITELEGKAGQGNDEKVKDLESKLQKATDLMKEYKSNSEKLIQEKTELETGFNNKLKDIRINDAFGKSFNGLKFPDGTHDYTKKGFENEFRSKYKLDIDETGNTIITDKDGKGIASKTKTGVYLNMDEVLDMELETAGLKVKNNLNPNGGVNRQQVFTPANPTNGNGSDTLPKRSVNPRALANAEKLAQEAQ